MSTVRGFKVQVVKGKYDATAGGITSQFNELVLVTDGVKGDTEIAITTPHLKLNKRMLWGSPAYFAEPNVKPENMVGPMFGGNTIKCVHPDCFIPSMNVHDRFETTTVYRELSI